MLFCNIYGEIPSALSQEKKVHLGRKNFLGILVSQMGDPGPQSGHLGEGMHPRSPLLSCRAIAGCVPPTWLLNLSVTLRTFNVLIVNLVSSFCHSCLIFVTSTVFNEMFSVEERGKSRLDPTESRKV